MFIKKRNFMLQLCIFCLNFDLRILIAVFHSALDDGDDSPPSDYHLFSCWSNTSLTHFLLFNSNFFYMTAFSFDQFCLPQATTTPHAAHTPPPLNCRFCLYNYDQYYICMCLRAERHFRVNIKHCQATAR